MDLNLKGKRVAITGGSSGIGRDLAIAYAKEECKVAVCGRSLDKLNDLKEYAEANGLDILTFQADVTDCASLDGFVKGVSEAFGGLDIMVNNAGFGIRKPFDELPEEEWHIVVDTNIKSVYYGSAYAAREMRKGDGGVIINTSSFTSVIPTCGVSMYSAAKAAVDSLTKTFAAELAADNIRVLAVQPGMTVTPLARKSCEENYDAFVSAIPLKKLAETSDMYPAYLFLSSDKASYITGISLQVAGGKLCTQNPHYSYRDKSKNF